MINRELSLIGKPEGSVWINFQTGDRNLDNNYLETDNSIETEEDTVENELDSSDDDEEVDDGSGDSVD